MMRRPIQQERPDAASAINVGQAAASILRAAADSFNNLRGDRSNAAGRIIAEIGIDGVVAPFEFISFRHSQ